MKKIALLFTGLMAGLTVNAQVNLTGTSYTEDFDNLSSGLPAGWSVYTGADATSLGTDVGATRYNAAPTKWNSTTGQFRNVASADNFAFFADADSTLQQNATDRALALRQVGQTSSTFPGSDPGGAFAFQIGNTTNLENFKLSFKLQSLDSASTRSTVWTVDYAIGSAPSAFTSVAVTGNDTTGGNTYSNNIINVDFGSALDNQSGPVWIRIAALTPSTGSGNRPTTGIDDFQLTWDAPNSIADNNVNRIGFNVIGNASSDNIKIGFTSEGGKYSAGIFDLTGRQVHSQEILTVAGAQTHNFSGLNLTPGMYIIKLSNGTSVGLAKVMVP